MEKPKSVSVREFVDGLPYIGEYYQPNDEVYIKDAMDEYIEHLRKETKDGSSQKGKDTGST